MIQRRSLANDRMEQKLNEYRAVRARQQDEKARAKAEADAPSPLETALFGVLGVLGDVLMTLPRIGTAPIANLLEGKDILTSLGSAIPFTNNNRKDIREILVAMGMDETAATWIDLAAYTIPAIFTGGLGSLTALGRAGGKGASRSILRASQRAAAAGRSLKKLERFRHILKVGVKKGAKTFKHTPKVAEEAARKLLAKEATQIGGRRMAGAAWKEGLTVEQNLTRFEKMASKQVRRMGKEARTIQRDLEKNWLRKPALAQGETLAAPGAKQSEQILSGLERAGIEVPGRAGEAASKNLTYRLGRGGPLPLPEGVLAERALTPAQRAAGRIKRAEQAMKTARVPFTGKDVVLWKGTKILPKVVGLKAYVAAGPVGKAFMVISGKPIVQKIKSAAEGLRVQREGGEALLVQEMHESAKMTRKMLKELGEEAPEEMEEILKQMERFKEHGALGGWLLPKRIVRAQGLNETIQHYRRAIVKEAAQGDLKKLIGYIEKYEPVIAKEVRRRMKIVARQRGLDLELLAAHEAAARLNVKGAVAPESRLIPGDVRPPVARTVKIRNIDGVHQSTPVAKAIAADFDANKLGTIHVRPHPTVRGKYIAIDGRSRLGGLFVKGGKDVEMGVRVKVHYVGSEQAKRVREIAQKWGSDGGLDNTARRVEEVLAKTLGKKPGRRPKTKKGPGVFYHGSYKKKIVQGKRFGGIHLGTEAAALGRMDFHTQLPRRLWDKEGVSIIEAKVTLKKPFGGPDNPILETGSLNEKNLYAILNNKKSKWHIDKLKARGYDGIYYKNVVEDPGSVSVLVFNEKSIKQLGRVTPKISRKATLSELARDYKVSVSTIRELEVLHKLPAVMKRHVNDGWITLTEAAEIARFGKKHALSMPELGRFYEGFVQGRTVVMGFDKGVIRQILKDPVIEKMLSYKVFRKALGADPTKYKYMGPLYDDLKKAEDALSDIYRGAGKMKGHVQKVQRLERKARAAARGKGRPLTATEKEFLKTTEAEVLAAQKEILSKRNAIVLHNAVEHKVEERLAKIGGRVDVLAGAHDKFVMTLNRELAALEKEMLRIDYRSMVFQGMKKRAGRLRELVHELKRGKPSKSKLARHFHHLRAKSGLVGPAYRDWLAMQFPDAKWKVPGKPSSLDLTYDEMVHGVQALGGKVRMDAPLHKLSLQPALSPKALEIVRRLERLNMDFLKREIAAGLPTEELDEAFRYVMHIFSKEFRKDLRKWQLYPEFLKDQTWTSWHSSMAARRMRGMRITRIQKDGQAGKLRLLVRDIDHMEGTNIWKRHLDEGRWVDSMGNKVAKSVDGKAVTYSEMKKLAESGKLYFQVPKTAKVMEDAPDLLTVMRGMKTERALETAGFYEFVNSMGTDARMLSVEAMAKGKNWVPLGREIPDVRRFMTKAERKKWQSLYGDIPDTKAEFVFEPEVAKVIKEYYKAAHNTDEFMKYYDRAHSTIRSLALMSPSYLFRNSIGNFFNNFLGGLKNPAWYGRAQRLLTGREYTLTGARGTYTGEMILEDARRLAVLNQGQYGREVEILSLLNQTLENTRRASLLKELADLRNIGRGPFARKVFEMNVKIENNARLAGYMHRLNLGDSPEMAAKWVKKHLFDYAELTRGEQRWGKRIMFFYTWTRKNLPLQIEMMAKNPMWYISADKGSQMVSKFMGQMKGEDIPDWLRDNMVIFTGSDGTKHTYMDLTNWLPTGDLVRMSGPMRKLLSGKPFEALHVAGSELALMATPFIRSPIEQIANYDVYFRQPIQRYIGETGFTGLPVRAERAAGPIRAVSMLRRYMTPRQGIASKLAQETVGIRFYELDTEKQLAGKHFRINLELGKLNSARRRAERDNRPGEIARIDANIAKLIAQRDPDFILRQRARRLAKQRPVARTPRSLDELLSDKQAIELAIKYASEQRNHDAVQRLQKKLGALTRKIEKTYGPAVIRR